MARPTMTRRTYEQACPVAKALDLVGERWTLLIIRDLFFGSLRFTDLRDGLPGLAPNLLSDRLRLLCGSGLVRRTELAPPGARTVYELTDRGRELGPVVNELSRFGVSETPDYDAEPPPPRLVRGALLALMAPEHLDHAGWVVHADLGTDVLEVQVTSLRRSTGMRPLDRIRVRSCSDGGASAEPQARISASLGTLHRLHQGTLTVSEARRTGQLRGEGHAPTQHRFGALLGWL